MVRIGQRLLCSWQGVTAPQAQPGHRRRNPSCHLLWKCLQKSHRSSQWALFVSPRNTLHLKWYLPPRISRHIANTGWASSSCGEVRPCSHLFFCCIFCWLEDSTAILLHNFQNWNLIHELEMFLLAMAISLEHLLLCCINIFTSILIAFYVKNSAIITG